MRDLKSLRERAGFATQLQAAQRVGVTERCWGRWERGELTARGERAQAPKSVIDLLELLAEQRERESATEAQEEGTNND